jgi:hypothetical protein
VNKRVPFDEFVKRARSRHGDRYQYLPTIYKGVRENTLIVCPVHGEFEQDAGNHLSGNGCPKCGKEKSVDLQKMAFDDFVRLARIRHGDKYEYLQTIYDGSHKKTQIVCPAHGVFEQVARSHIVGNGCPKCGRIARNDKHRLGADRFIGRAREKHGDKYNYSRIEYIDAHTNVIIICPDHGEFPQEPNAHLKGQGCPSCRYKGEAAVGTILLHLFQKVARQAPIRVHCRVYKFDFQIQDFEPLVYVEYHGQQHYKPVDFLGKGDEWAAQQFARTQRHDQIKADWCKRNGYPLIVIPYWIEDVRSYVVKSLEAYHEKGEQNHDFSSQQTKP